VENLRCGRCSAPRDHADNFCRRCGHQLTVELTAAQTPLPSLRPAGLPARPQTIPRSLVGSVAVLAIGTGIEWAARRFGGTAARAAARAAGRAATRALVGGEHRPALPASQRHATPGSVSVDEFIYVRKVELRR
jgi:hypothetical protein